MMTNKLNFKELYDYLLFFFKCIKEIYECFTLNNNNITNFKELIIVQVFKL
jgi:hypothetical protein